LVFGGSTGSLIVNQQSDNTVVAGAGNDTMFGADDAAMDGSTFFIGMSATSNTTLVEGATSNTVVAGSGSANVWGGSGGTTVYAGSGMLRFLSGSGAAMVYGSDGSDVSLFGTASNNLFIVGAGSETVNAIQATGSNSFAGGSGSALLGVNPNVAQIFSFTAGQSGGSETILGFSASSEIHLIGNTIASSDVSISGTQILLSDGTKLLIANYFGSTNVTIS
jgi:Ca2+-binding RTX toxin-like protein